MKNHQKTEIRNSNKNRFAQIFYYNVNELNPNSFIVRGDLNKHLILVNYV